MESDLGGVLTALARAAVESSFTPRPPLASELIAAAAPEELRPRLAEPAATFVTLERDSRLRGCIGALAASRPLGVDVVRNARLATRDPRLPAVTSEELPDLTVTVAVLSPSRALAVDSFGGLIDALRPGTDGLTLSGRDQRRRATFLPSVWHALREPERFVAALLRKGGWPRALWAADLRRAVWPDDLAAERYTAESFSARWAG
ncbi:AmmeMemoRadiSam system protein A [Glycomyces xiaoerkulensis]|uniref:AmmeMemoRadiSam system protein A n=1 Tax=Glycomyces xiaoerkulensis TaxID=2038139 RepID=UPI0013000FE9|nr:AmmeMemoRadiSam system protein A [Glycomyces xiaoerkulensis]